LSQAGLFQIASKDRAYPRGEHLCVSSIFTCRHYTWLESLARGKHSSLLGPFVSYGEISFVNTAPCRYPPHGTHTENQSNPSCAMTLSIMTFSIMTLSIKGLCVTLIINDPEHNNACHYSKGHYAVCGIFIAMLNVVRLSVVAPIPTGYQVAG